MLCYTFDHFFIFSRVLADLEHKAAHKIQGVFGADYLRMQEE